MRIYRNLLWFYPCAHRQEYGLLMEQLFRDQYQAASRSEDSGTLLALWLRILPDLAFSAIREHLTEQTNHMKNLTSRKTTSIIAAVIGTLCAAYAAFVEWTALAVIAKVGYPVLINDRLIWWPLYAAVILWAFACYGFISRRKHAHDHAA